MDKTAEKIKLILHDKKLTQSQLADILSTSRTNVANAAGGFSKPNWEFLTKLHTELNVNLNWLIADTGSMYNQTPNEALKEELRKEFEELMKSKGL